MRGKVDLAKRTLADQTTDTVVAHRPKIFGVELAATSVSRFGEEEGRMMGQEVGVDTLRAPGMNWQADSRHVSFV